MNEDKIINIKPRDLGEGEWADIVAIRPDGSVVAYDCKATLENLQFIVGGNVEVVPFFNKIGDGLSCAVLCNEEGKLRQYPINTRATLEWAKCYNLAGSHDMLVGDVVVLSGKAKKEWER